MTEVLPQQLTLHHNIHCCIIICCTITTEDGSPKRNKATELSHLWHICLV